MSVVGQGTLSGHLPDDVVDRVVQDGLGGLPIDGRRVLVIVPDGTRTMPMPFMFDAIERAMGQRVQAMDFLIALGTHAPMSDAALSKHVGRTVVNGVAGSRRIFNHRWDDPSTFLTLGSIPAADVAALTEGRLRESIPVALNRLVVEYDHVLICGPVFPHEVVGFSGGTKYLFPGIAAPEIIHFTHWLGALLTSYKVIGTADTPVRTIIDRAAGLLSTPLSLIALVVTHHGVAGAYCGDVHEAWRQAASLSASRHIVWVDRPFKRVLSVMPAMYEDLWTAAKGMYKTEPVVADDGEVVIYAPHVGEVSFVHGRIIDEIGYHCRDYFTAQWDRFKQYPGGILAHSTHVKGLGAFDASNGRETPRIRVTLATGIPRQRCDRINLGYADPATVDSEELSQSHDADTLVVPRAGELLFRVQAGMMSTAQIGVVGLGVMGGNLARNIERHGFPVAGYDLDPSKTKAFINGPARGTRIIGVDSPNALMHALERPRRVLIMVPAGPAVDSVVEHLGPQCDPGDIFIDGGNSHFSDTDQRTDDLAAKGLHFVGMGVSGGEEGALRGPSIMPGGSADAWNALAPILRAIAAKAEDGEPCVAHMGPRGAGHYVKMVHNGIEYGDMQLIAEVYDLLRRGAGLQAREIAAIFAEWNAGELRSYLVEITARVLEYVDSETGQPMVDRILDEAQQKGTGKWMSQNGFDIGAPIPTVNAAVEARLLSAMKAERVEASKVLDGPPPVIRGGRTTLIEAAGHALYVSKIMSYAQGMAMLRLASAEYGYGIDPGTVASVWRAGCIIRAALLSDVRAAFQRNRELSNLLLDEVFRDVVSSRQNALRDVVQIATGAGVPVPAMSASLAYYDSYRSERLPANLTQAQRDFFGAHTYRRIDREGVFHTEWTKSS